MIRIIIQQLAIFLLPILLYVAYLLISRRLAVAAGRDRPKWEDGPWFWLVIVGLALSAAFFVGIGLFEEPTLNVPYVPPSGPQ
jgi:uncharacterized membrane protein YedE/YeeE